MSWPAARPRREGILKTRRGGISRARQRLRSPGQPLSGDLDGDGIIVHEEKMAAELPGRDTRRPASGKEVQDEIARTARGGNDSLQETLGFLRRISCAF